MKIDEEKIRRNIISKLHHWLESFPNPDQPIIGVAGEEEALTPRQIVRDVDDGTEEGERFVRRWVELAVEHIMDSDLQADSDEPLELADESDTSGGF
jgi:hypothetical protein